MQAIAQTGSMPGTTYVSIGQIKALGAKLELPAATAGCDTHGGEGKASCGSSGGPDDMPQEIWDKVKNHPCYSEEAHHHYARMHVAVAPACNIQCNYCNRKYDCSNERSAQLGAAVLRRPFWRPERSRATRMKTTHLRAPPGDIASQHWQGGPVNCGSCCYAELRALPGEQGCEPGHACMQDVYARRIDRFFRWHPRLGDEQLAHAYFEVRAITARHASVFRLTALMDDADETVRLQIALRLPQSQLLRLANDPHREVRICVAQRLPPAALAALRNDPDYGVRELVALRLPLAILPTMALDVDRAVRMRVAQRLPAPLLSRLVRDDDWRVRGRWPSAPMRPRWTPCATMKMMKFVKPCMSARRAMQPE
jgi:hypothetical protein